MYDGSTTYGLINYDLLSIERRGCSSEKEEGVATTSEPTSSGSSVSSYCVSFENFFTSAKWTPANRSSTECLGGQNSRSRTPTIFRTTAKWSPKQAHGLSTKHSSGKVDRTKSWGIVRGEGVEELRNT